MNIADMKILMANVTNLDNRDKRHRQKTNQGTLRSSLDSPCSPLVEESDRHLPFQHTSIAAFVWIPHFYIVLLLHRYNFEANPTHFESG